MSDRVHRIELQEISVYEHPADKEAGIPPLFKHKTIITDAQERVVIEDISVAYRVKSKYED